jgi:hypothetical protein
VLCYVSPQSSDHPLDWVLICFFSSLSRFVKVLWVYDHRCTLGYTVLPKKEVFPFILQLVRSHLCRLKTSGLSHHARRILKEKKIGITGRAGALTDLVVLRNIGYNDYAIWRKPRPSTLRC